MEGMSPSPVTKVVLSNGVRVLLDPLPHGRSAAIGFWLDTGSRDEPDALAGTCHFLEHMLFKGTRRRSALQIAQALEVTGGSLNAFTDKEHTCFHARVPAADVPEALDVLADMLVGSLLDAAEIRREKAVVIEEIKMYEDTPDDLVQELTYAQLWPAHSLGRPVTGTPRSVRGLSRTSLRGFMDSHYTADRLVVAIAGKFDHGATIAQLEATLRELPRGAGPTPDVAVAPQPGRALRHRDVEQVQLVVAAPAMAVTAPERYVLAVLNAVVGGGMSSRLFQEVREKRGLVYAISSFLSPYLDGGTFGIYAGTGESEAAELVPVVLAELAAVQQAVTEEELARAKAQVKASLLMSLESTSSRCEQIAHQVHTWGRVVPMEETLAKLAAVTRADVTAAARTIFRSVPTLAAVGPVSKLPELPAIAEKLAA